MTDNTINGWNEWSKHVLAELKRLNTCYETLEKANSSEHIAIRDQIIAVKEELKSDISISRADIAVLKVKAGLWGAAAGAVPGIIALIWYIVQLLQPGG